MEQRLTNVVRWVSFSCHTACRAWVSLIACLECLLGRVDPTRFMPTKPQRVYHIVNHNPLISSRNLHNLRATSPALMGKSFFGSDFSRWSNCSFIAWIASSPAALVLLSKHPVLPIWCSVLLLGAGFSCCGYHFPVLICFLKLYAALRCVAILVPFALPWPLGFYAAVQ